jgi:1,4-alpha-glucan branching enzyme
MSMNRSAFGPNKSMRAMNFICNAPHAQSVSLVGDFNQWNPATHRMNKMPDGAWLITVELKHGHHRYAFLVDAALTLDPRAQGITRNDQGERVSLVPVS